MKFLNTWQNKDGTNVDLDGHTHAKSEVGLSNVDNTSDANKPVSTAAQNALATKAPLASPSFSGTVKVTGTAASQPFRTRGIVGCDSTATNLGELYLQYGAGYPTYFGSTASYNISADGSTYSGKSAAATKLATARAISLIGDATGSVNFDGSGDVSITTNVEDDSHNHTTSTITDMPTNLSQFTNDIGAGAGTAFTVSSTAPVETSPGDYWYKIL
ncbi:hypothetical protein LNN31_13510 [Acetobacterium wieringae]|uniref:Phage tail protein n=1 Tax=Acetobacterium wieringae TaxID=52694 RepID=A0ABY6HBA5_9FIRM|nr:hypothetical protein [Acetobacterium wieringae]UYO61793.1 hypothetical protein LNN31_13510 [Acetobacterium wieringae]